MYTNIATRHGLLRCYLVQNLPKAQKVESNMSFFFEELSIITCHNIVSIIVPVKFHTVYLTFFATQLRLCVGFLLSDLSYSFCLLFN